MAHNTNARYCAYNWISPHNGFRNSATGTNANPTIIKNLAKNFNEQLGYTFSLTREDGFFMSANAINAPKAAIMIVESYKHLYWKLLYSFTLEQPVVAEMTAK